MRTKAFFIPKKQLPHKRSTLIFNFVSSGRPVVVIDSPAFFKGNTFQVAAEDDTTNPRFYVSSNKTTSKQFAEIEAGHTVQGAFAGNLGGYIGKDGTLKIRFSVSRFFKGKVFNNQGGSVQRETMNRVQVGKASVNPAVAALRNRMPKPATEVVVDDY